MRRWIEQRREERWRDREREGKGKGKGEGWRENTEERMERR